MNNVKDHRVRVVVLAHADAGGPAREDGVSVVVVPFPLLRVRQDFVRLLDETELLRGAVKVELERAGRPRLALDLERRRAPRADACMVKRSEKVNLGGLWLEGRCLSEESEVLGLSSRVRRAAPSLQTQADEPAVASCGLAKTAASAARRRRASRA